jgi:hypothetical protein
MESKDNTKENSYGGLRNKQYDFEVKVTNKMAQGLVLSPKFFWLLDQFNYGYEVREEEYQN